MIAEETPANLTFFFCLSVFRAASALREENKTVVILKELFMQFQQYKLHKKLSFAHAENPGSAEYAS